MRIRATVRNTTSSHAATVETGEVRHSLNVPPKPAGRGSAVNGGEFLMLALATCYCNDLFREAARLHLVLDAVEVEASAEFAGVGLAATDIRYTARVQSSAPPEAIDRLLAEADAVAEVHNTLRAGVPVRWVQAQGPQGSVTG